MRALAVQLLPDNRRQRRLVYDWPEPRGPVNNEVKVQTIYTGVTNGTERNVLMGGNYAHPDDALPVAWGYQNVGRVVEVGPEVHDLRVGDIAYMSAEHVEYVVMSEDGLLIRLPLDVDARHAALFGMSAVAVRTCRTADPQLGEEVLIVGAGFVGQMVAQVAAVMGARVTIGDVDAARLDIARRIGSAAILDLSARRWEQAVADGSFDVVIDVAGVPGMEDQLIVATRPRGRVLFIAGRAQVTYTFNLGQNREITLKQNSHFDREDLGALLWMVRAGKVRIGPLVQDVVPVDEAAGIYDRLRDNPQTLLGSVFIW